jgi:hypothetical protein
MITHVQKAYLTIFLVVFASSVMAKEPRQVFGWLETVKVTTDELKTVAKLDSGAKTSSIHANKIKPIRIDRDDYVEFEIVSSKKKKTKRTLKVYRVVKVKSSNGALEERYSVMIPMQIAEKSLQVEFTLSDRAEMNYPILLGRKTIEKIGIIDCSRTFLSSKKIFVSL